MKNVFVFALCVIPLFAACQHDKAMTAAEDFYLQYADREDMTVSLLAGYEREGTTLNVVKLQAQTDDVWWQLLDEFRVHLAGRDSDTDIELGKNVDKVTSFSKTDTLLTINGDTVDGLSDMPDYLAKMLEALVNEAVATDTAVVVRTSKHFENDVLVEEHYDTLFGSQAPVNNENAMLQTAKAYGNSGYGVVTDEENRTLWVLFYNTVEELMKIMFNIMQKK